MKQGVLLVAWMIETSLDLVALKVANILTVLIFVFFYVLFLSW